MQNIEFYGSFPKDKEMLENRQIKSEKGLGELVNIHSKILKEILGNRYNNIVEALVGIEIVYINEKYSSGKFTKSYA